MTYENELRFLEDILEVEEGSVHLDAPIEKLENWDSINILAFMAQADDRYEVSVTAADLVKVKTVKELLNLLKSE